MRRYICANWATFLSLAFPALGLAANYTVAPMATPADYAVGSDWAILNSSTRSNYFAGGYDISVDTPDGADIVSRPGLWQGTTFISLPVPPGPNVSAGVVAVNSAGTAAGGISFDGSTFLPAIWSNGNYQLLPVAANLQGGAQYINDQGLVGGYVTYPDGHYEAAIWQNGALTLLGTFGRANSTVFGLNNSGAIAINSYGTPDETYGTGILQNGMYTPITIPSAASVIILDLNDNGTALLHIKMPDGTSSYELRNNDGTFVPLPLLAGTVSESPLHLNNQDQVVGSSSDDGSNQLIPTLWENGVAIDIRSLLSNGVDYQNWGPPVINDDGAIVVVVQTVSNDVLTNLLLTPDGSNPSTVPEPASLAVLSIGGLTLLKRRRSRRAATHQ